MSPALARIRAAYEQSQRERLDTLPNDIAAEDCRRAVERGGLDKQDRDFWRSEYLNRTDPKEMRNAA